MVRGAGAFRAAEGNIAGIFLARCRRAPRCEGAHARPHAFCRDPGRSSIRPACRGGTVWGRRKPKPVTDGLKRPDGAMRPVMSANKGAHAPAEPPEERASTKGNPGSQGTRRTQCRASVTQAADRIRQAVERNPQERLTAPFRHMTPEVPGASCFVLKEDAAAGVERAAARPAPTPAQRGSVPRAAGSAGRDAQAGRRDTTARDRGTGGQDRPESDYGRDPDASPRGGVSRIQLRVPTGPRCA